MSRWICGWHSVGKRTDAGSDDLWSPEANGLDDSEMTLTGSTDLIVLASNSTVHRDFASRSGRMMLLTFILIKVAGILVEDGSNPSGVRWIEVSTSRLGIPIGNY